MSYRFFFFFFSRVLRIMNVVRAWYSRDLPKQWAEYGDGKTETDYGNFLRKYSKRPSPVINNLDRQTYLFFNGTKYIGTTFQCL